MELVEYFMRYSTIVQVENKEDELEFKAKFPFKCISVNMTVAAPPFNKGNLSPIQNNQDDTYRVITFIFDIYDTPLTKLKFQESLLNTRLHEIFSQKSLRLIKQNYKSYMKGLAE